MLCDLFFVINVYLKWINKYICVLIKNKNLIVGIMFFNIIIVLGFNC